MIEIRSLAYSYSKTDFYVFKEVNLSVYKGETVVLLGENGAGKSTLLNCLLGFIKAKEGDILIEDQFIETYKRKELAQKVAFVSTEIDYKQMMQVKEFVGFGRYPFTNWFGKMTYEDKQSIDRVLKECSVDNLQDKMMSEISDGERQKVVIARALAQETDVLLLDEPTTHLDIKNTRSILQLLKDQSVEKRKTILFSTHQVERAIKIADKIWLFDGYQIIECTPHEFNHSKELKYILYGE